MTEGLVSGKARNETLGCQGPESEPLLILNISGIRAEFWALVRLRKRQKKEDMLYTKEDTPIC